MSNPLDNKIKEALENFEMPYDAGAWAELAQQLPPAGTGATSTGGQFNWKGAAIVAGIVTTIATVWYLSSDVEPKENLPLIADQEEVIDNETTSEDQAVEEVETVVAETSEKQNVVKKSETADESKVQTADNSAQPRPETPPATQEETPPTVINDQKSNDKKPVTPTPTATDDKAFVAKFIPSSVVVCVGEDVSFINESSDKSAAMVWNFGDGTVVSESDPIHSYVLPGTYTVRLTGTKNASSSEHSVQVVVNPTPSAVLSPARKLEGYQAIPFYKFSTALQPSETAVWKFSDGSITEGTSAEHLFRNAGKSGVTLTVRNNFGCATTLDWEVDNEKFNLLAYTGFSPDGNGNNETFMPAALPVMNVRFQMVIRDQTGQIVYETSNANEPWNGRLHNNGRPLDAGIYVWTVIIKDDIINKKDFNGTITLKR